MKTVINKLLKARIAKWSLPALLIAVVAASIAWSNEGHRRYQLGGGFIGNNGAGNIWNALQIPLDPEGRTAALRVNEPIYTADFAGLLTAFGADAVSEFVGEVKMISRDTAKFGTVAYAKQQGNPPQLRAILVMNGTVKFTGPDNIMVTYTVDVYPAAADADLDGYPDAGAVPAVTIPGLDYGRRVPIR
jgi:hypothetical protein